MTLAKAVQQFVRNRAGNCCEYCRLPAAAGTVPCHKVLPHMDVLGYGFCK